MLNSQDSFLSNAFPAEFTMASIDIMTGPP